jgi:hypothetical protein
VTRDAVSTPCAAIEASSDITCSRTLSVEGGSPSLCFYLGVTYFYQSNDRFIIVVRVYDKARLILIREMQKYEKTMETMLHVTRMKYCSM